MTDVLEITKRYVGNAVAVTESTFEFNGITYPKVELTHEKDPLLTELEKELAARGYSIRVWLPGTHGTMDNRLDRVNVYIEKKADSYQVMKATIG